MKRVSHFIFIHFISLVHFILFFSFLVIFKLYFIFFQISFYFIFLYKSCFISYYFTLLYQGVPGGAARLARGRKRPHAPRPQYIQRHMQGLICVNPKRGRTPQSSCSRRSYESKLGFRVSIVKKIRFRGLYTRGGPLRGPSLLQIPLNPILLTLVTP